MPQPIIVGDAFTRTYTRYESDGVTPIDFTGETVVWKIVQGSTTRTYAVTATPAAGQVVVHLTDEETAALSLGLKTSSYLEFTQSGGDKYTRGRVNRESVKDR